MTPAELNEKCPCGTNDRDNCGSLKLAQDNLNNQLNEAVAKKLGWAVRHDMGAMRVGTMWTSPDGKKGIFEVPSYSTSIEAAWEIVEKFIPGSFFIGWGTNKQWSCRLRSEDDFSYADTAPLAIVNAFLKLQ